MLQITTNLKKNFFSFQIRVNLSDLSYTFFIAHIEQNLI